jgi:histidinol-phosphate aminotransferase
VEPRPELLHVGAPAHGGLDLTELARLGLDPDQVLDFSVNTNPFGPSPGVGAALAHIPLDRYPDPGALLLRRALAESLDVPPDHVLVGNGASELIWLTALAFVRPGDRVLILGPTYGEYARAAALMGASVQTYRADEADQFVLDAEAIGRLLRRFRPRLVFLCNPNNPTGTYLDPGILAGWTRRHGRTLFVVDEAYLAFAPQARSAIELEADNVVVLGSLTKDLGLAGLRLGYAVGPAELVGWLTRAQPPWSVNALAQAAGLEALRHPEHAEKSLAHLRHAKAELVKGLANLGLSPVPSAVHSFLLKVGNGRRFRRALLRFGMLVRDGASFGLPAHVRIATRRPAENARLLAAIRRLMERPEVLDEG